VDELVGLTELRRLSRGFDEVVVDTAPTGHTLRLLAMPATLARLAQVLDDLQAKHRAMARSLRGSVRRDAEDALIEELQEEARSLQALLRSSGVQFHWVTLLEELAIQETRDGVLALRESGLRVERLIANRLTPPPDEPCALCLARRAEEARMLEQTRAIGLPLYGVPEQAREPRGPRHLGTVARALRAPLRSRRIRKRVLPRSASAPAADQGWLGDVAGPGVRLVLFGGKGGVGKTTAAAAAAISIARRGDRVLLLSTDPAHSIGDVLGTAIGDQEREVEPRLWAFEPDAARAFERRREKYRTAVEELFAALRGGSSVDAPYDRAVMEDLIELAPPGLDELFALLAVIEALQRYPVVVADTAPTGHALRLFELVGKAREWVQVLLQIQLKYRRVTGLGELARDLTGTARELRELQQLLVDPGRARFVAVTRAAALPRQETARLLSALRRLRIAARREEWGIRVLLDEVAALRRAREEAQTVAAGAPGAAFLLRKKKEHDAAREAIEHARDRADELFELLAAKADDARRRPPPPGEVGKRVLLDAAFLLPRRKARAFQAAVRASAKKLSGRDYQLTLSGPWPAYTFVADTEPK